MFSDHSYHKPHSHIERSLNEEAQTLKPYSIVGIGEILWDLFPNGPRFGGAPSNFECSISELAGDRARVHVVSAVGRDEFGRCGLKALSKHQVDTSFVQVYDRETGKVLVELDTAGVASYRFAEQSAWDEIEWSDKLLELASNVDVVCFGTLGQRASTSRHTILRVVQATRLDSLRILDVNLRAPYINNSVLIASLKLANVLKLNDQELPHVCKLLNIQGDERSSMESLSSQFGFDCVALTRGDRGAAILRGSEFVECESPKVEVVDTVGAGDAFTAALTLGLLQNRNLKAIASWSVEVAAHVCTVPGATTCFSDRLRERAVS